MTDENAATRNRGRKLVNFSEVIAAGFARSLVVTSISRLRSCFSAVGFFSLELLF